MPISAFKQAKIYINLFINKKNLQETSLENKRAGSIGIILISL